MESRSTSQAGRLFFVDPQPLSALESTGALCALLPRRLRVIPPRAVSPGALATLRSTERLFTSSAPASTMLH